MKLTLSLNKKVGWYSHDDKKRVSNKSPKSSTELGLYKISLRTHRIDVVIDNYRGIGSTIKSKTLFEAGCLVHLTIENFLALCKPSAIDAKGSQLLKEEIEAGASIGNPALVLSLKQRSIVAHDGQKRALALQKLGFKHIPVMLFFSDYKARQIPDWTKFEEFLNKGVKSANRGRIVRDFVIKLTHA